MAPDTDELKRQVCAAADARRADIVRVGTAIWKRPEVGFKEHATAALVADELRKLGLAPREALGITGVKAVTTFNSGGPTLAILGELDALPVRDHPDSDPTTGAVHACGHNTQIAHMLGVAMVLKDIGAASLLSGRVAFIAVPAEEYVELEWRREQMDAGRIEFLGGKPELIKLGEFDDVDMAMMVHSSVYSQNRKLAVAESSNGMLAKRINFRGRAAHAGTSPHRAINALNAATLALSAIHFQRETFQEEDTIRIHPIITKGGEGVNIVPADVRVETFVRGSTLDAIRDAEMKVDRCCRAGAMAIGATVEIDTLAGYLPLIQNDSMRQLFKRNAISLVGEDGYTEPPPTKASTDAGDLSHVIPVLHPSAGGFAGTAHGPDFQIVDDDLAYLNPVKAMAMTLIDLLADNARAGQDVVANTRTRMTKDEYLTFMRDLARVEVYPS